MTRGQNTIKAYNVPAAVELVTTKLVGYAAAIATLRFRMVADSSIVMFGGIARDIPYPGSTMVTTVNNGIVGLVKTLSIELAPTRVNAVHPGLISDSPYWANNESVLADGKRRVLADRLPTMRDIVERLQVSHAQQSGERRQPRSRWRYAVVSERRKSLRAVISIDMWAVAIEIGCAQIARTGGIKMEWPICVPRSGDWSLLPVPPQLRYSNETE
jgi:NAD(P)-dependent dehydrogenase (short-subunit alcohol dehydrogenase family)